MYHLSAILFLIFTRTNLVYQQVLYQCNYDTHTIATGCLLPVGLRGMLVSDKAANLGAESPTAPLSDVTSSLMPTDNGQNCTLPYKVTPFTWDMYFCNDGYCQTQSSPNAKCQAGKFGYFNFGIPEDPVSFVLNTNTGGTNGTGHQCLSYFYYLPTITGTQQNINIRVKTKDGDSEMIDQVMSSPHNGWSERRVSFVTTKDGYEMYFDLQKTSGKVTPLSIVAIDEILIRAGRCEDEPVTLFTSVTTKTTITSDIFTRTNVVNVSDSDISSTSTVTEITSAQSLSTSFLGSTAMWMTTTQTVLISTTSLSSRSSSTITDEIIVKPNQTTLIIILSTVVPIVLIASIVVLIWIMKKSSLKRGRTQSRRNSSINYRTSASKSVFELNRVAPA
ncbi:unnamed protein product [Adineta ricciae]|uniref:MAM domain-containing protein n=1 Tax=Adineta ricciae TaxID=249248 RepID=A0A814HJP4_ADIRI|nr:unnamed protein product [Adineta ricciae]